MMNNNIFNNGNHITELMFTKVSDDDPLPRLCHHHKYWLIVEDEQDEEVYLYQSNNRIARLVMSTGLYRFESRQMRHIWNEPTPDISDFISRDKEITDRDVKILKIVFSYQDFDTSSITLYVSGVTYSLPERDYHFL